MRKIIKSFQFALEGIFALIKYERNAKIHLVATLIVICSGFYFEIKAIEWVFISLAIALVFITEGFNTAIENLVDYVTEERHPTLKKVKDIAAGAVLIAAIFAIVIACIIFIPYLI